MSKSKLLPFVLIGAVAGAAISMFDKNTRSHTVETSKLVKDKVSYYATNSDELLGLVESKFSQVQSLYSNTSENIMSLVSQAEESKLLPESIQSLLQETKSALGKK